MNLEYQIEVVRMYAFFLFVAVVSLAAAPARATAKDGHACGPPALPENGGIEGGARQSYSPGDYVEYACDYGYTLDGPNAAVCIHNAEGSYWNNPPPKCNGNLKYRLLGGHVKCFHLNCNLISK